MKQYVDYITDGTCRLLAIDSPTGYTAEAASWVKNAFEALGYEAYAKTCDHTQAFHSIFAWRAFIFAHLILRFVKIQKN